MKKTLFSSEKTTGYNSPTHCQSLSFFMALSFSDFFLNFRERVLLIKYLKFLSISPKASGLFTPAVIKASKLLNSSENRISLIFMSFFILLKFLIACSVLERTLKTESFKSESLSNSYIKSLYGSSKFFFNVVTKNIFLS